jgi:hypothetical protein
MLHSLTLIALPTVLSFLIWRETQRRRCCHAAAATAAATMVRIPKVEPATPFVRELCVCVCGAPRAGERLALDGASLSSSSRSCLSRCSFVPSFLSARIRAGRWHVVRPKVNERVKKCSNPCDHMPRDSCETWRYNDTTVCPWIREACVRDSLNMDQVGSSLRRVASIHRLLSDPASLWAASLT